MKEEYKDKLLYIAHSYTGDIEANMLKVNTICNRLLDLGYWIYSPLTMSHPLEILQPRDHKFWILHDLKMLEMCDVLVLCGDWVGSRGCNMELQRASKLKKQVITLEELLREESA